ncbi:hypothetical protein Btru_077467 [Bulinus truncatus]|nr:hypothetical protein Btru_077467 [Bulinus truncatus]
MDQPWVSLNILTNGPAMAGTIDFRGVVKPEGNVVTVKALCDYKPSGPDDAQLSLTIRKRSTRWGGSGLERRHRQQHRDPEEHPFGGREFGPQGGRVGGVLLHRENENCQLHLQAHHDGCVT